MNYLGRVIGNLKGLYSGINGATLTGAIDVIVVEQEDGTFICSPFHVRFGKLGVLRSREKVVDIELNGIPAPIRMKLGDSGEAFFVQEVYDDYLDDENLATSPLPGSPKLSDGDSCMLMMEGRDKPGLNNNNGPESVLKSCTVDDKASNVGNVVGNGSPPKEIVGSKGDDSKTRKRRKKRKRNQGSKSNIVVDPTYEQAGSQEGIFKMDEELNVITHGLQTLDISSVHGQQVENQNVNQNNSTLHQSRIIHRDFYSDTEADPTSDDSHLSPIVQSDSEYEITKAQNTAVNEEEVDKWPWGELPISTTTGNTTPVTTPMGPQPSYLTNNSNNNNKSSTDENPLSSDDEGAHAAERVANTSVLGSMFSFMTKRHLSGNGGSTNEAGIYLDDLNLENMDPEMAALYFPNFGKELRDSSPRRERDEDVESGHGSSLTQSPAPGSSPNASHVSVYMNDHRQDDQLSSALSSSKFEAISMCGSNLALFEQSQLTFDELVENPDLILNAPPEAIVVKMDGQYLPWSVALPQLLSTTFFKRPLPSPVNDRLMGQFAKKDEHGMSGQSLDVPSMSESNSSSSKDPNSKGKGYSWFPWRRSTEKEGELESSQMSPSSSSPPSDTSPIKEDISRPNSLPSASADMSPTKDELDNSTDEAKTPIVEQVVVINEVEECESNPNANLTAASRPSQESCSSSSDESEGGGGIVDDTKVNNNRSSRGTSVQPSPAHKSIPPQLNIKININLGHPEKYKKSLRLTSDQIAALGLRYGQNEAVFSVTTAYQGTTVARCHIYLWRYDDRIVISDIDGTITKSDVLGHILPIIGTDWAQSGVAQLFTQIQDNGYKMLYLSARAIGQATSTREYLRSIKQDDVTLPDGPLLLNPTSLMSALHREVIEKKPEDFKIACLKDIQTLFPINPFYAGYGNKINDVWAYRAVEIAIPRIFTINHKGELRHALTNTFNSSYTSLGELAEFMFPVYKKMESMIKDKKKEKDKSTHAFSTTDGFSAFEYWRDPLVELPGLEHDHLTNTNSPTTVATSSPKWEFQLLRPRDAVC